MRRTLESGPAIGHCTKRRGCGAKAGLNRWLCLTVASLAVICAPAFMLGATSAKAQNSSKSAEAVAGSSTSAANGKRLFKKDGCYECHGLQAQGSPTTGPRLGPDPIPLQVLIEYVRKPTGQMPPYTDKVISDKELGDIYAFLKSLPHPPPAKSIPLLH